MLLNDFVKLVDKFISKQKQVPNNNAFKSISIILRDKFLLAVRNGEFKELVFDLKEYTFRKIKELGIVLNNDEEKELLNHFSSHFISNNHWFLNNGYHFFPYLSQSNFVGFTMDIQGIIKNTNTIKEVKESLLKLNYKEFFSLGTLNITLKIPDEKKMLELFKRRTYSVFNRQVNSFKEYILVTLMNISEGKTKFLKETRDTEEIGDSTITLKGYVVIVKQTTGIVRGVLTFKDLKNILNSLDKHYDIFLVLFNKEVQLLNTTDEQILNELLKETMLKSFEIATKNKPLNKRYFEITSKLFGRGNLRNYITGKYLNSFYVEVVKCS